jgi:uncharacterized protein Usg
MTGLSKQLADHRLTTAEILYHLPDHPALLQSYLWQDYDTAPHFPVLRRFLAFWQKELDGRLHSVWIASLPVIQAPSLRHGALYLTLH